VSEKAELRRQTEQAMEMAEYGKGESHETSFPPFPHSLEIPSGLPHSHGLGGERGIKEARAKTNPKPGL
jgi:hypothetical protein